MLSILVNTSSAKINTEKCEKLEKPFKRTLIKFHYSDIYPPFHLFSYEVLRERFKDDPERYQC